jgi:hypothetical protein
MTNNFCIYRFPFITTPRAHARLEDHKYCSLQRCLIPLTAELSHEAEME